MYKSHKVVKPNKPAEVTEDKAIFWNMTKRIEEEVKNLERKHIHICQMRFSNTKEPSSTLSDKTTNSARLAPKTLRSHKEP